MKDLVSGASRKCYELKQRESDPRLAHVILFSEQKLSANDFVLIGFLEDRGTKRNLGRTGAARGPNAIREQLGKLVPPSAVLSGKARVVDLGDIVSTDTLLSAQERLGEVVDTVLKAGAFPIILGGGHETSYGHFLGVKRAKRGDSVFNIDAHLDLRPLVDGEGHSGSQFRQMFEDKERPLKNYAVYGVQRAVNAETYFKYAESKGSALAFLGEPFEEFFKSFIKQSSGGFFISLDLDVVRQSDAPGVSSPCAIGLSADELIKIANAVGKSAACSLDVVECNPDFDRDGQTARLAARFIYEVMVARSLSL